MTASPSPPRRRRRSLGIVALCLLILAPLGYFVFYPAWAGWLNFWAERHRDDWLPRLWRGEILESFGHFEEATADFKRLLELRPDRDVALLRLGLIALADRGRYADAQRYLGRYLEKHPDDP